MTNPHITRNIIETTLEGELVAVTPLAERSLRADEVGTAFLGLHAYAAERFPRVEATVGGTGYLDQFFNEDLPGPVAWGVDEHGRRFIAFQVRAYEYDRPAVVQQRYQGDPNIWVTAGDNSLGEGLLDQRHAENVREALVAGVAIDKPACMLYRARIMATDALQCGAIVDTPEGYQGSRFRAMLSWLATEVREDLMARVHANVK